MKIEEHEKAYQEHLRNIEKIIDEGIEENQRNVGYNIPNLLVGVTLVRSWVDRDFIKKSNIIIENLCISQGSVELFSIYLHKFHLIEGSGDQFDHRVFKSSALIKKKIPFEFLKRKLILELMKNIEDERIALCYGT